MKERLGLWQFPLYSGPMKNQKFYLFGNWKMNGSVSAVQAFSSLQYGPPFSSLVESALFLPFPYLFLGKDLACALGAQDCSAHEKGAYTGDVSAFMVKEMGASYVLVGHSERRTYHQEGSSLLREKLHQALKAGLVPVLCIGEALEDRQAGRTLEVLGRQLQIFNEVNANFILAYEPLWAIGTGIAATLEDIDPVFSYLKSLIDVPCLYGGSVTQDNAPQFMGHALVNGLLVGGASLLPAPWQTLMDQAYSLGSK